jgi:hypothetical protein
MTVPGQFPRRMSRALFFVPVLAALAGAAVRLWREEP